jgi:hypothetical protein
MDSTEQLRKPRWFVRWMSPLQWRFWTVTLPTLFILIISVLFTWPGLEFKFQIGDEWLLQRSRGVALAGHGHADYMDQEVFRAGPLEIAGLTFKDGRLPMLSLVPRGFYTLNDPCYWAFGYSDADSVKELTFEKDWRLW